jgi:hypothetical protein
MRIPLCLSGGVLPTPFMFHSDNATVAPRPLSTMRGDYPKSESELSLRPKAAKTVWKPAKRC